MTAAPKMVREVELSYGRSAPAPAVRKPDDVARFVRDVIGNPTREHFLAIFLDGRHQPIGYQIVSIGTAVASLVHPREVFQPAIAVGAVAIVVAHNHPTGNPDPSPEDREITKRLREAGTLLGIELLDHVIVVADGFTSLRETGDLS